MVVHPIIGDVLADFGLARKPEPMSGLVVYPEGTDRPGVEFRCANGFVCRVVSAVADVNIPDAEKVCAILNDYYARGGA